MNYNRFNNLLVNYPLSPPKIVHSYTNIPSEPMILGTVRVNRARTGL